MIGEADSRASRSAGFRFILIASLLFAVTMILLVQLASPAKDLISTESLTEIQSGQLTPDDMSPFEASAVDVLTRFEYWSETDRSDLPDACGLYEFPCLDRIGKCVQENLVDTEDGKITPRTQVCSCFAQAYQAITELPGHPDLQVQCPFHCVATIFKIAERYVSKSNGPAGPVLHCAEVMRALSVESFGNRNSMISGDGEMDSLAVTPINEPSVLEAAEAFRLHINQARSENCKALPAVTGDLKVIYAKAGLASEGSTEYRIEVALGGDVFFARIARLPKFHQLIDPFDRLKFNDTDNLLGRFRIMSCVPAPCSTAAVDQLAVSASGMY